MIWVNSKLVPPGKPLSLTGFSPPGLLIFGQASGFGQAWNNSVALPGIWGRFTPTEAIIDLALGKFKLVAGQTGAFRFSLLSSRTLRPRSGQTPGRNPLLAL